ncbi:HEXXH motif domain-containing protein [Streptomyces sp. NPDC057877]|uniref:HEXXH motif domain-containing protein n=1 Tax=Streptomyces sp. NPDC057877 TaxID=3346269 RepID=UPI0036C526EA
MITTVVPDEALDELGRTEGGEHTLALLVHDQHVRRLLLVRAVLDAVGEADPEVCSAATRRRLREDWGLLVEADRAAGGLITGNSTPDGDRTGGSPLSPARARLFYPMVGAWALSCLRAVRAGTGTSRDARVLRRELAYFSALVAAVAARSGIPFTAELTARDGVLMLPSLGVFRTAGAGETPVVVDHRGGRLTIRQRGAADAVVHLSHGAGASSAAPAWTPVHTLPALVPGFAPVELDDIDPFRSVAPGSHYDGLSGTTTLDDAERKRWLESWQGTADLLGTGGEHRVTEAVTLLRCLVPLSAPPRSPSEAGTGGSCSGTRREAFGAVLTSTPPTAATFAATIVHELQHAKLAALHEAVALHHAGEEKRYWAPWRPDPRHYDGLLQGTYSHLALADFFQRCALTVSQPVQREFAWSRHARYREQVRAALPTVAEAACLTRQGRRFVDQMAETFAQMADRPVPQGYAARAAAYVTAARDLWVQRYGDEGYVYSGHP